MEEFNVRYELGLEDLPGEVWKDVVGYEGIYKVSSLGRVKSLERRVNRGSNSIPIKEKIKKQNLHKHGYYIITISKDGIDGTSKVHRLVAMAFLGHKPCKFDIVVDHINSVPTDNRAFNLQLVSHRENISKGFKKGGTSQYTGVHYDKSRSKWRAVIQINGKEKFLGRYKCELKASFAYDAALKLHLAGEEVSSLIVKSKIK